ncbi:MAG TPA: penicillin-binding transpeptidase domain-containing protein [Planococcus sp. (in: firmicutes)]|nr:penicillin-binding transpeptidase domain-containing protein [Planococcus sp. (in: firmicutes)]
MRRKWKGIIFLLLFILLAGCQEEAVEQEVPEEPQAEEPGAPEIRLTEFIGHWNEADLDPMFNEYLYSGAKQVFGEEVFLDWQRELHDQLQIRNINVTYTEPENSDWPESEPADFRVNIAMDSIAGTVDFDRTVTLVHEEQEGEEDWFVEWGPSYILPDLESGDNVLVETTMPVRGEIVDRNGQPVAVNGDGFEIGVIPQNLTSESRKQELAELLDMSYEALENKLTQSWVQPNHYVPVAQVINTSDEDMSRILGIPGVQRKEILLRHYPYGASLSHITGYIGPITAEQLEQWSGQGYTRDSMVGRQGLERALEEQLRGEIGARIFIEKSRQRGEKIQVFESDAGQGNTIELTIDAEMTHKLYRAMRGHAGTAAAIDPQTGETLALVSLPGFNPNEFVTGISSSRFNEISGGSDNPLFNRFAASYRPGAGIQPITAAIGLEAGTLNPEEGLNISGRSWQRYASWGDHRVVRRHADAPNPMHLNEALAYADNIYFARQAMEIEQGPFLEALQGFGFGEEVLSGLTVESSQISNGGSFGSEGQFADTAYGQGQMETNILHLAAMYAPILNNGTLYQPVLFADEESGQVWNEGLVSAENAEILRNSLRSAISEGVAKPLKLDSIPLAGINSTLYGQGDDNGIFVGFHSGTPDFIVAMLLEDVEGENDTAEKAANFFKAYYE